MKREFITAFIVASIVTLQRSKNLNLKRSINISQGYDESIVSKRLVDPIPFVSFLIKKGEWNNLLKLANIYKTSLSPLLEVALERINDTFEDLKEIWTDGEPETLLDQSFPEDELSENESKYVLELIKKLKDDDMHLVYFLLIEALIYTQSNSDELDLTIFAVLLLRIIISLKASPYFGCDRSR